MDSLIIYTNSASETRAAGHLIGEFARAGDVFLLTGPLGAGKTCLLQGIAQGLDVVEYARSPTFVLATRYQGRLTLHHADLYRIGDPAEAWDLGLEDVIIACDDVLAVEWADRRLRFVSGRCALDRVWTTLSAPSQPAKPCPTTTDRSPADTVSLSTNPRPVSQSFSAGWLNTPPARHPDRTP